MTPLSDTNQDCWNFLWREGDVVHVQIWDRDKQHYQKDDYMFVIFICFFIHFMMFLCVWRGKNYVNTKRTLINQNKQKQGKC